MKFTCQRENLLNGINIVSKAVSGRTTLPILECILLTVSKEGFKLTANNLELGIETAFIDADVEETGIIAIEAKIFSEIIQAKIITAPLIPVKVNFSLSKKYEAAAVKIG